MPKITTKIPNLKYIVEHQYQEEGFIRQLMKDLNRTKLNIGSHKNVGRSVYQQYPFDQNNYEATKEALSKITQELIDITKSENQDLTDEKAKLLVHASGLYIEQNLSHIPLVIQQIEHKPDASKDHVTFTTHNRNIIIKDKEIIFIQSLKLQNLEFSDRNPIIVEELGECKYSLSLDDNIIDGHLTLEASQVPCNNKKYYELMAEFFFKGTRGAAKRESLESVAKFELDNRRSESEETIRGRIHTTREAVKNYIARPLIAPISNLTKEQILLLLALEKVILSQNFDKIYSKATANYSNASEGNDCNYADHLIDEAKTKLGDKTIDCLVAFCEKNLDTLLDAKLSIAHDNILLFLALEKVILSENFSKIYSNVSKNYPSPALVGDFDYADHLIDEAKTKLGHRTIDCLVAFCEKNLDTLLDSNDLLATTYKATNSYLTLFFYYMKEFLAFIADSVKTLYERTKRLFSSPRNELELQ